MKYLIALIVLALAGCAASHDTEKAWHVDETTNIVTPGHLNQSH
jgi:hypothetical protein